MKRLIGMVVVLGMLGVESAYATSPKDVVRLEIDPCSSLQDTDGSLAHRVCVAPRNIHAGEGVFANLVYRLAYRDGTRSTYAETWGQAYEGGTTKTNSVFNPLARTMGNIDYYTLWLAAGYNLNVKEKTFLGITYKVTATMQNILDRSVGYKIGAPFIPMPDFESVESVTNSLFSSFDFDTLFDWSTTVLLKPWRLDQIDDVDMRPWELVTDMHRIASTVLPTPEQVVEGFEHLDVTRGMRAPQTANFLKSSVPLATGHGGAITRNIKVRIGRRLVYVPVNMVYYKGPTSF